MDINNSVNMCSDIKVAAGIKSLYTISQDQTHFQGITWTC